VANGVQITAGNTVLRGAGSGEGGTELFIDKMNTQNGSCYFLVAPPKIESTRLATITAPARRESHELVVDDTSRLTPGRTIVIKYSGKHFVEPYFAPLQISSNWKRLAENGMRIHELHTIERIDGKRVRLREPLHLTIVPQEDRPFEIQSFELESTEFWVM